MAAALPRHPLLTREAVSANPVSSLVLRVWGGPWLHGHLDDAGHPMTAWEYVDGAAKTLGRRFHCHAYGSVCVHFQVDWHADAPDPAHTHVRVLATRAHGRVDRAFEQEVERLVYAALGPAR